MDFETAVYDRRSIRGYRQEPVPRAIIDEIVTVAKQAPSSMNVQPWHFHAVTGEPLERIRAGNTERIVAGAAPDREIRTHGGYEGVHRERQKRIAVELFDAMGIAWEDKERREDWAMRGFRQFDAPVSIVVTVDRSLDHSSVAYFGLGAATYGLVLAAWSRGLGCVINGQGITQSSVVREHAKIPDDEVIVTCVAVGYPDETFSANEVKSSRMPNEGGFSYVGFDD